MPDNTPQSSTPTWIPAGEDALRSVVVDRVLPGRNGTKADVLVGRVGTVRVAVKDYRPRSRLVRATLGRWLTRRETSAYAALAGTPGVPRFLGRWGPYTLATEWIDARPLPEVPPERLGPELFERLEHVVRNIHARGVALGDLHHRDVLVGGDGAVHVVDLATAWRSRAPRGPGRRLFGWLCDQDRVAVARLRARSLGEDEDRAIDAVGAPAARRYRIARRVRRWIDRLRGRPR